MSEITGWADDYKMLMMSAELFNIKPAYLLEDLIKETGEQITLRELESGVKMPMGMKNLLRQKYNERMAIEMDTVEKCRKESKKIIEYMLWMIVIVATVLWLGSIFV